MGLLASLVAACAGRSLETRQNQAEEVAKKFGMASYLLPGNLFTLFGYTRFTRQAVVNDLTIYLEGDGLAWIDRYTISNNPTPINPLALKLAGRDPSGNVSYLARPCQFVDLTRETNCRKDYWTGKRYSDEVVSSMNTAVSKLMARSGAVKLHLVGYSGGGAIAVLLASRRADVSSIRTVAGNLDPVSLFKTKNVTPLYGSLDPTKVASKLKNVPQIHFSGSDDVIVPPWVASDWVKLSQNSRCVRHTLVLNTSHSSGWEKNWSRLLLGKPMCFGLN